MCRKIKLVSLCAFSVAFAVTGAAIASSDDSTNAANAPNATNGVTVRLSFPAGAGCVLPARDVTFSPASEQVSPDEVGVALWTSYLAYTPSFYAVHTAKTAGFTQSEFVDEGWGKKDPTGFQALVASRAGVRIVSVRGSSEMSDWSSNSNDTTRPVWSLGIEGWIHRGYADQVESAVSNVKRALDRGNDEAPVIVTGHSLGGAVASVLATKLAKDGYPIGRLVTFAAPRAGDETFARAAKKALGKRAIRVVRPDDYIPRISPTSANAELGARIFKPEGPEALVALDAAKFRQAKYDHFGRYFTLDGKTGAFSETPAPTDTDDAAFLGAQLAALREAVAAGPIARLKFESDLIARHDVSVYACPFFTAN